MTLEGFLGASNKSLPEKKSHLSKKSLEIKARLIRIQKNSRPTYKEMEMMGFRPIQNPISGSEEK